jgi:hypothetical protein
LGQDDRAEQHVAQGIEEESAMDGFLGGLDFHGGAGRERLL